MRVAREAREGPVELRVLERHRLTAQLLDFRAGEALASGSWCRPDARSRGWACSRQDRARATSRAPARRRSAGRQQARVANSQAHVARRHRPDRFVGARCRPARRRSARGSGRRRAPSPAWPGRPSAGPSAGSVARTRSGSPARLKRSTSCASPGALRCAAPRGFVEWRAFEADGQHREVRRRRRGDRAQQRRVDAAAQEGRRSRCVAQAFGNARDQVGVELRRRQRWKSTGGASVIRDGVWGPRPPPRPETAQRLARPPTARTSRSKLCGAATSSNRRYSCSACRSIRCRKPRATRRARSLASPLGHRRDVANRRAQCRSVAVAHVCRPARSVQREHAVDRQWARLRPAHATPCTERAVQPHGREQGRADLATTSPHSSSALPMVGFGVPVTPTAHGESSSWASTALRTAATSSADQALAATRRRGHAHSDRDRRLR